MNTHGERMAGPTIEVDYVYRGTLRSTITYRDCLVEKLEEMTSKGAVIIAIRDLEV